MDDYRQLDLEEELVTMLEEASKQLIDSELEFLSDMITHIYDEHNKFILEEEKLQLVIEVAKKKLEEFECGTK